MDHETDGPVLVIDGRPRSWEEIGRLLLSYEGWEIGIEISDSIKDTRGVPQQQEPSTEFLH